MKRCKRVVLLLLLLLLLPEFVAIPAANTESLWKVTVVRIIGFATSPPLGNSVGEYNIQLKYSQ